MLDQHILQPVPRPMHAELLLSAHLTLDARSIAAAIAARGLNEEGIREWVQTGEVFHCTIDGGEIRIEQRTTARDLATLATQMEGAATWWNAWRVQRHTHVIEVTVGSAELSAGIVGRIVVRLTAALIDLADDTSGEVLGALFGGTRLLPADFVQQHAMADPAFAVLAALHIGKPGDGYMLRTSGMADLGLPELVVIESDRDVREVALMMQDWIQRLMVEGPHAIHNGATLGEAGRRIDVRSVMSRVGDGVTYQLSYAADQSELSSGRGRVKLSIEGQDTVAIAGLLATHDPAFDTVIEASDYLREHYANGRVDVRMHRVFATKLYADAEKNYPALRVHSDEALGVLRPDSSLFHSPTSDTAMQDAIAAARASTAAFVARLEAPQPGDHNFGVKFPFRDGDEVEHMWVGDVHRIGEEFVGTVEADAQCVRNVARGSTVRVPMSEISDWGFSNGKAIHGNYTTRVMLDALPPSMRKALAERLVPLR